MSSQACCNHANEQLRSGTTGRVSGDLRLRMRLRAERRDHSLKAL